MLGALPAVRVFCQLHAVNPVSAPGNTAPAVQLAVKASLRDADRRPVRARILAGFGLVRHVKYFDSLSTIS